MNSFEKFGKVLVATAIISIACLIAYIFIDNIVVRGVCVGVLFAAQLIPIAYNSVAATRFVGKKWNNSHIIDNAKTKVSNKMNEIKDNRAAAAAQKEKDAAKRARVEARMAAERKGIEDEMAAEEAAAAAAAQ
jgi:hypothetical protein